MAASVADVVSVPQKRISDTNKARTFQPGLRSIAAAVSQTTTRLRECLDMTEYKYQRENLMRLNLPGTAACIFQQWRLTFVCLFVNPVVKQPSTILTNPPKYA